MIAIAAMEENLSLDDCCFLCCSKKKILPPTTAAAGRPRKNNSSELSLQLQNLLDYLNIDVFRLTLSSTYLTGKVVEGRDVMEVLAESLCQDCSAISAKFEGIYRDFESARLRLVGVVHRLSEKVKMGGWNGFDGGLMKAQILKQCNRKIQTAPRVELERVTEEIDDDSFNSSESSVEEIQELDDQPPPNSCEMEGTTTEGEFISSWLEKGQQHAFPPPDLETGGEMTTFTESSTPAPRIRDIVGSPNKTVLDKKDEEIRQVLEINQGLIRQLSEAVTEHITRKRASQSQNLLMEASQVDEPLMKTMVVDTTPEVPITPPLLPPVIISCLYCGAPSPNSWHWERHMKLVHTVEHYQKQFPQGTTKEDVSNMITNIILNEGQLSNAGQGKVNCGFCGGIRPASSLRYHLIHAHINIISSRLETEKEGTTATTASSCHPRKVLVSARRCCLPPMSKMDKKLIATEEGRKGSVTSLYDRNLKKCLYCGVNSVTAYNCHIHMLGVHLSQYCAKLLPRHSTEDEVEAAIRSVIVDKAMIRRTGDLKYQEYSCDLCSKVCRMSSKRLHTLVKHFPEVVATLRKDLVRSEQKKTS